VRSELLARLREHERLQWFVRIVVQPEVHRHVDVHDGGRSQRERRLFGRRDLSHHVRGQLLGQLWGRFDLYACLSRERRDVDRRKRQLSVNRCHA